MNNERCPEGTRFGALPRRVFLKQCGMALGPLVLPWTLVYGMGRSSAGAGAAAAGADDPVRRPVVSLHMDQPFVDLTGTASPHLACPVFGAAAPLMALSDLELRTLSPYL